MQINNAASTVVDDCFVMTPEGCAIDMGRPDSPTGMTEFPAFDPFLPEIVSAFPVPADIHAVYDMPLGYLPADPFPRKLKQTVICFWIKTTSLTWHTGSTGMAGSCDN